LELWLATTGTEVPEAGAVVVPGGVAAVVLAAPAAKRI
jgi:hypothetical protein